MTSFIDRIIKAGLVIVAIAVVGSMVHRGSAERPCTQSTSDQVVQNDPVIQHDLESSFATLVANVTMVAGAYCGDSYTADLPALMRHGYHTIGRDDAWRVQNAAMAEMDLLLNTGDSDTSKLDPKITRAVDRAHHDFIYYVDNRTSCQVIAPALEAQGLVKRKS